MDKLDVRIVREFMQGEALHSIWPSWTGARPAIRALSKKLGVTENTVRARTERLSEFLPGWTLMPNPSLTGEKSLALGLDVPPGVDKQSLFEKIALLEDVVMIIDHAGPHVITVFRYRDQEMMKMKTELIVGLAQCERLASAAEMPFPPCGMKPRLIDLQIVASRQRHPLKSDREIAVELGISLRTVRRRYVRLVREGVVWPIVHLNIDGLRDGIYAHLTVMYEQESRASCEARILPVLSDFLVFNGRFEAYSEFRVIVPSITVASGILEDVRRLKGVRSARIDFVQKRLEFYDVYRRKVDELIEGMTRTREGEIGQTKPKT